MMLSEVFWLDDFVLKLTALLRAELSGAEGMVLEVSFETRSHNSTKTI